MTKPQLQTRIKDLIRQVDKLYDAIKKHHDQRADDRCFLDDDELYAAAGLPPADTCVGDVQAMLANCRRFIEQRCTPGHWPSYADLEARIKELEAKVMVHETPIGGSK